MIHCLGIERLHTHILYDHIYSRVCVYIVSSVQFCMTKIWLSPNIVVTNACFGFNLLMMSLVEAN